MTKELTSPEQYSELWGNESDFLETHGIYEKLSKMTPKGKTLEFGCGSGRGTNYLSVDYDVLSLDSNPYLISRAEEYLNDLGVNHNIHQCDFFNLSKKDKNIIKEFKPEVIVGWFIGSNGVDIYKHTSEESNELVKSKLYREKIEDIIVSPDVCLASVKYIHLANRGGTITSFSEDDIFKDTKIDYDTHVFGNIGFEVYEVKNMDWPRDGSNFQYGQAPNPNLAEGESIPTITSIIAKRIKKP